MSIYFCNGTIQIVRLMHTIKSQYINSSNRCMKGPSFQCQHSLNMSLTISLSALCENSTFPACSNDESGALCSLGWMQWPVVDDCRVVLVGNKQATIDVQPHLAQGMNSDSVNVNVDLYSAYL